MILAKLTNNTFNWESKIDTVMSIIKADESDKDLILQYCSIVEEAFYKATYIAIVENTYRLDYCDSCEVKPKQSFSQVLPLKDSCDVLVDVEVDFLAGYEELPLSIFYDLCLAIKGVYDDCSCMSSLNNYFLKYINPLGYKNECQNHRESLCCC